MVKRQGFPELSVKRPVWDEKTGEIIEGVYFGNDGRYQSLIFHPVKKIMVRLGTYATVQQASQAYQAKLWRVCSEDEPADDIEEESDELEILTNPDQSSTGLRKEIVFGKSSKYNGGGAMGFMIPDSHGAGNVFLPVIDNHGFLIGKFSEGDVSVLDDWLSTKTSCESQDVRNLNLIDEPDLLDTETDEELETGDNDVPTQPEQNDESEKNRSKRKEVESDSPQPAKKKKKSSRQSLVPCAADALSSTFYDAKCQKRWETKISQRNILPERPADLETYKESGFTDFLNYLGFTTAATVYEEYNKELVQEFYSNLKKGNLNPNSKWYNLVYIRGKVVRFSGELINELLGLPVPEGFETAYDEEFKVTYDEMLSEISGGYQSEWPAQGSPSSSSLSTRYFCLYQLAINCWIPSLAVTGITKEMAKLLYCIGTKTRMNLGVFLQESIVAQAVSPRKDSLPYFCIISALMRGENVKVKKSDEVVFAVPIKATKRTLTSRIVKDLPWTPAESTCAEKVKEAKLLAIDGKVAAIEVQIAALEAERAKLIGDEA